MSEKHIPAALRRLVADRSMHCCEYCRTQAQYSADAFIVDHITPRSLGGSTTHDNLALCCYGCNQHKPRRTAAPDPVTDARVPLFHPPEHRWEEHFAQRLCVSNFSTNSEHTMVTNFFTLSPIGNTSPGTVFEQQAACVRSYLQPAGGWRRILSTRTEFLAYCAPSPLGGEGIKIMSRHIGLAIGVRSSPTSQCSSGQSTLTSSSTIQ